jgi:hypothetical protein
LHNIFVTTLAGLLLALAATSAVAKPSNKWRLEFSGGADSDGTIVVQITPEGGAPLEASIDVPKGTGENAVAKHVVKGLKAQLPGSAYKVERDDGEDVLIKKRSNTPKFDVVISSNTVKGVKIHPKHE